MDRSAVTVKLGVVSPQKNKLFDASKSSSVEKLVDQDGIRLYVGDVLKDRRGEEWLVCYDGDDEPYRGRFYLKKILNDTTQHLLPGNFSTRMKLL